MDHPNRRPGLSRLSFRRGWSRLRTATIGTARSCPIAQATPMPEASALARTLAFADARSARHTVDAHASALFNALQPGKFLGRGLASLTLGLQFGHELLRDGLVGARCSSVRDPAIAGEHARRDTGWWAFEQERRGRAGH